MDRRKREKSNAGMSLLEVIVAVSIFSIAAIVLLQSFVTSSHINRKSNTYLEATSTAQNVMEEIKSKRFDEVALAFNYPIDVTTNSSRFTFLQSQISEIRNHVLDIKEVLKDGDEYKNARKYLSADGDDESKVTASVISKDDGKTYKFNANDTDKYYYVMSGVENENETFDVLVEFDGSADSGYKKKTASNNTYGKNDYLAPNISKLDTKKNAFLIMEKDWDKESMEKYVLQPQLIAAQKKWDEAFGKWKEKNTWTETDKVDGHVIAEHPTALEIQDYEDSHRKPSLLDYEDVYAHTRRILRIKLEKSGGSVIAKAKYILCAYDYKKEGATESEYATMSFCPCEGSSANLKDEENRPNDCLCTFSSNYTTFYSSENEDDLQSIYIFYYPNYNSTNTVKPLDEIYFDNSEIYVKDGSSTVNYPVNFYVTKQRDEVNNEPTSAEEIAYRMSLTVTEKPTKPWSANIGMFKAATTLLTNLDYDISNFTDIPKRTRTNQMKLTYTDGTKKVSAYSAKNILSYNGLDNRQAKDRIYTATVKVYKKGAADSGFLDSDLIVTLDGAKED